MRLRASRLGAISRGSAGFIPALDLNSMSGAIDGRITFTRGTQAWDFDKTGVYRPAPHNLLWNSANLSAWGKFSATVDSDVALAPDLTLTADRLNATAADSGVFQGATVTGGLTYTGSIWLRADTPTAVSIFLTETSGGAGNTQVACNVTTTWQRFSVTRTLASVITGLSFQVGGAGSFSAGEVVYAWGGQMEIGSAPTAYNPTLGAAYYGPRIGYDPVTLAVKGLLVEEQCTNLLTFSADYSQSAWAKSGVSLSTAISAPDGMVAFRKIVEANTNAEHLLQQAITAAAGTTYTHSMVFKSGERSFAMVGFSGGGVGDVYVGVNLTTGAVVSTIGAPSAYRVDPFGPGVWRVSVSKTAAAAVALGARFGPSLDGTTLIYQGDGASGIYAWGSQLEIGSAPSSYIPTGVAQATRGADVPNLSTSTWFNPVEGTVLVDWMLPVNALDTNALVTFDANALPTMSMRMGNNGGRRVRAYGQIPGGSFEYAVDAPLNVAGTAGKSAFTYRATNGFSVADAGASATDSTGSLAGQAFTTMSVGRNGTTYANGYIRRVRYWRQFMTPDQIATMTL